MRCVAKVVLTVLALLGLSGVACHLFLNKETLRKLRAKFRHHRHHHHADQHHVWNEPPRHGVRPELVEARRCHEHCGDDKACHEGCPLQWTFLEKKCEETQGIMACHAACRHNHTCHVKCPLPGCPHMQGLVNATLKCHGFCASGNYTCHSSCPKPFVMMKQKCDALQCRKRCGSDPACQHECPELMFMKDLSRHSHHGDREHHGHHHHWHHHHDHNHDHDDHDHHEHGKKAMWEEHHEHGHHDHQDDREHRHHWHHWHHWQHHDHSDDDHQDHEHVEKALGADHDDHHGHPHEKGDWRPHHWHHHDHDEKAEWYAHHGLRQEHGHEVNRDHEAHAGRDGDEARRCHEHCGDDEACHEGCPMPWTFLEKMCEETQRIMACHAACRHNHTCHVKCPLPGCPHMQGLVNATLKCHGLCCASGNHTCHSSCPKPFVVMKQKCDALQCRKRCGFDPACQRECPELMFMKDLSHEVNRDHEAHAGRGGDEAAQEVLIEVSPEKFSLTGLWQRLKHYLKSSVPWEWAKGLEVQV